MNAFINRHRRIIIDVAIFVALFIFICLSFVIFKPLYFRPENSIFSTDGVIIRIYIYSLIGLVVLTGILLKIFNKLTFEKLLFLIFLLGVVMQLNYMLITPTAPYPKYYRQHDVFDTYSNAGHEGYAWTIFMTGKLPTQLDTTGHLAYQFYHPPLNAFMQATFMRFGKILMYGYNLVAGKEVYNLSDMDTLYQTSEILSVFYMNVAIYFGIKIAYKLKISNFFKACGAIFLALFPALFIQAGQLNNDPLCVMNCFIVIYFTIKWWEDKSYFNAAMIGLFTGLAMMAKLSGALAALPAVVAFIYVFIERLVKKEGTMNVLHIIFQGLLICAIGFPLGLWFQIYAKVKFDQPFGFVFSNLVSDLYVGDHSFFERFINIFDFKDMSYDIWGYTRANYNLPNFLIKSALFGEYNFMCADALAILALIFNYLFVYLSFVLMIIYFIKSGKEHLEIKILAGVLILTQLLAQLYFNIKMPYGCTMDFRYIIPIIIGFMILDCLAFDKFSKEKSYRNVFSKVVLASGGLLIVTTFAFYLFAI